MLKYKTRFYFDSEGRIVLTFKSVNNFCRVTTRHRSEALKPALCYFFFGGILLEFSYCLCFMCVRAHFRKKRARKKQHEENLLTFLWLHLNSGDFFFEIFIKLFCCLVRPANCAAADGWRRAWSSLTNEFQKHFFIIIGTELNGLKLSEF